MKNLIAISLISMTMVGCVKTSSKKVDVEVPEIQKPKLVKLTKSGYKCDITGEAESKEIFLKVESKDGKTTANFHDFTSADKVTIVGASFGDYGLLSYTLEESIDDNQILVGESLLLHHNKSLLSDEGEVLTVKGRLTLNKDLSGRLEQKITILQDDNTTKTTEFQEIGIIENCEEFEASVF